MSVSPHFTFKATLMVLIKSGIETNISGAHMTLTKSCVADFQLVSHDVGQ
jgi:hypothetical protein